MPGGHLDVVAFSSFPNEGYFKTLDTGEVCHGGGAVFPSDCQLAQIRLDLYKRGTHAGTERMRLKLMHDSGLTKAYAGAVSDWVYLDDFAEGVANWRGRVPFNFASEPFLSKNQRYYVAVETDGYTRTGSSFFVAPALDWPLAINTNEDSPYYAWAMEFFVYRKVSA